MDSGLFLFVRLHGKTHGPFSPEHLIELARGHFITRQTSVSANVDGPWTELGATPSGAALFEALPREYERTNRDDGPPLELRDIIAAANRPPAAAVSPSPVPPPSSAEHDVRSLLQLNLAIERAHGLHRLKPHLRRGSSRGRDYFLVMTAIGVVIFLVLLAESFIAVQIQVLAAQMPEQFWPILRQVLFHSPIFAWGLAAFAFYAVALGWLMFFVMEDY